MQAFTLRAPAKINLTLEVLAQRADGYHGIRSVIVPLDLADEIPVEPHPGGFAFVCDDPALGGDDNLVVRAFGAAAPENRNVRMTLHKRIPSQAGLGGGSSDAAAVLLAAADGAFGETGARDWLAIARSLGSDVPFFLAQTGALVEGTGERVTAVGALPPWHVLIVKPPVAVSTVEAYRKIDAHPRPSRPRNTSASLEAVEALQRADFARVQACMSNDFHDVIVADSAEIARAVAALREAGATNAMLAGSGACVFSLFEEAALLDATRERISLPRDYRVYHAQLAAGASWR